MTAVGIICDLDGLLAETEGFHFEAYRDVLQEYGIQIDEQRFIDGWLDVKDGVRYGLKHYLSQVGVQDAEAIQAVRDRKSLRFIEVAQGKLAWRPGAEDFLKEVQSRGIPCGVGTGCYRKEYEFTAETLGLTRYIATIVGGDDVGANKPEPDIFLEVAQRIGREPSRCIVFENSRLGLESAQRAGMKSVGIPSGWTAQESFELATWRKQKLSTELVQEVLTSMLE